MWLMAAELNSVLGNISIIMESPRVFAPQEQNCVCAAPIRVSSTECRALCTVGAWDVPGCWANGSVMVEHTVLVLREPQHGSPGEPPRSARRKPMPLPVWNRSHLLKSGVAAAV